jgi:hypothetical protein
MEIGEKGIGEKRTKDWDVSTFNLQPSTFNLVMIPA